MPAPRPKKGQQRPKTKRVTPLSTCRALVLVDSRPLREKVRRQYQNALRKFEKFSAELQQFKNTDMERYRLWYEGEFSREIISLHQSRAAVADLADWMEQIQTYAEFRDISLVASLRVLSEAKVQGRLDEFWADIVKEIEEEERPSNSHRTRAEKAWQEFEDNFEDLFDEAAAEFHEMNADMSSGIGAGPKRDESTEGSLRTLYYQLALRLHPDTNPQQSHEHQQLFHKVQEAYRDHDIEALEEIWKKLEGKSEGPFSWKTAAISEIISRKKALDQRSRDIGTELKYARQHPAWDFSKTSKNKTSLSTLKQKMRHALKYEQAEIDAIWEELNEQLQHLEKLSQRKSKRSPKVKRKV